MDIGCVEYITKPFNIKHIIDIVTKYVKIKNKFFGE